MPRPGYTNPKRIRRKDLIKQECEKKSPKIEWSSLYLDVNRIIRNSETVPSASSNVVNELKKIIDQSLDSIIAGSPSREVMLRRISQLKIEIFK